MNIIYDNCFDYDENDDKTKVFQIFRDVFKDERGKFMEVIKNHGKWPDNGIPLWFSSLNWIRQINRSVSKKCVIRGCHAQKGVFCQGKLVEAINEDIFDIITDARPQSKTFGVSKVYLLSPKKKNQLWVPRGFLHCVVFPKSTKNAILQYFCDNTYNHDNEFSINPKTLIPKVVKEFKKIMSNDEYTMNAYKGLIELFEGNDIVYSKKDLKGLNYRTFIQKIKDDYLTNGKIWYSI